MIFVLLHHPDGAIEIGFLPLRLIREGFIRVVRFNPVRFDVGLVDNIKAIFIAELIPSGSVRIMAGPHGIDIELFHELDILDHRIFSDIPSCNGIVFVAVHSLKVYRNAIDLELTILDFNLSESYLTCNNLDGLV
jgi:hypothetical protein